MEVPRRELGTRHDSRSQAPAWERTAPEAPPRFSGGACKSWRFPGGSLGTRQTRQATQMEKPDWTTRSCFGSFPPRIITAHLLIRQTDGPSQGSLFPILFSLARFERLRIESMRNWAEVRELVLPVLIIGCLLVLLVPLSPAVMDLLLAGNLAISVVILLTTVYAKTPLEFSVFPTVLLATTLSRLVLNVATTRMILTGADQQGIEAAGAVIRSFGQFVAGDRLFVGVVMFGIIFVIQMLVITKGATRISEVAARFALDGMPGRQLAIDADLNAGAIDRHESRRRRDELTRQADFYGAMDGASKFLRGDAVAGLIITLINIVGGLLIGTLQGGMSLGRAAEVYTKLTIGDGLVSQFPALLISLAAGLLITRTSQSSSLPQVFVQQIFASPRGLAIAGIFLAVLVFTQLPTVPLLLLGGGCLGIAVAMRQPAATTAVSPGAAKPRPPKAAESRVEDCLAIDPVELEVGASLVRYATSQQGGDLLARVTAVRRFIAEDLGIVLPKVRIRDNLRLADANYLIKVSGNVVAQGAVDFERVVAESAGVPTKPLDEPVFDHPAFPGTAYLIAFEQAAKVKQLGYRLLTPSDVIAKHLTRVAADLASELLTRDATRQLIDELRKSSPTVVDELMPAVMKLSEVQQVLQQLLREGIPIRQLSQILEAMGDAANGTADLEQVTEFVRQRLARTISARFADEHGRLHVVTLDPQFEREVANRVASVSARAARVVLPVADTKRLCQGIDQIGRSLKTSGRQLVLLTDAAIRRPIKQITTAFLPELIVLSHEEVTRDTRVTSLGIVGVDE